MVRDYANDPIDLDKLAELSRVDTPLTRKQARLYRELDQIRDAREALEKKRLEVCAALEAVEAMIWALR